MTKTLRAAIEVGAIPRKGGVSEFAVWAPDASTVAVVVEEPGGGRSTATRLTRSDDGYFTGEAAAAPRTRYRYLVDDRGPFPDPASRWQPDGPFGPSAVVDPRAFGWTDQAWRGPAADALVVYEMHVGTFTREGTWRAACAHLARLRNLGISAIEMMPVADFPGRFGWGYDGVSLYAPSHLYGEPDDLRAFVDAAHAAGIAVILDVVYNHIGVSGSFLAEFSKAYHAASSSDWGPSFNFDGPDSTPVREFVSANAAYWVREFHFDGLRLDAVHAIRDRSPVHIVRALAARARAAAGDRR
ncbi:MAG TPA: alpha-amylase family glycosyl hydrolase, partial [Vicinamibacterales bacterium]|nr:alpha-amylase family glycosyl hydrolase [Vicinamibacterales bacterium]